MYATNEVWFSFIFFRNIRNENWEGAIIWQEEAWSFFKQEKRQDITDSSMTTALYLLQGMIIYMVGKMDRKNMKAADMADDRIKTLFKFLTKALKISLIIKPRLYFHYILSVTIIIYV